MSLNENEYKLQNTKQHITDRTQALSEDFCETRQRSSSFSGSFNCPTDPQPTLWQYIKSSKLNPAASQKSPLETQGAEQTRKNWQQDQVKSKRKRNESPTEKENKQPASKRTNFSVPVHNSFDPLSNEEKETSNPVKEYIPKPEPIFVTGVINISPLRDTINKVVDTEKFTLTTLRSGHIVKVIPKDIETYKTIRDTLIEKNVNHYTYKLKSERAYRVVIRGLHASEDLSLIKSELESTGHEVRQVVNVLHRVTKEKLPLYFVDLEQRPNNKDVFNIKQISQIKVTIEAPYKKKEVLQCKRCQRFGHSKNQCFRPYRCVKCGNNHPTTSCTKPPEINAACVNCQGNHPASYRGCQKYKEYKERIFKIKPKPDKGKPTTTADILIPSQTITNDTKAQYSRSYSDALKSKFKDRMEQITNQQSSNTPLIAATDNSQISNLLDVMFNRFQETMKSMMDSMMDRMVQLITSLVLQRA